MKLANKLKNWVSSVIGTKDSKTSRIKRITGGVKSMGKINVMVDEGRFHQFLTEATVSAVGGSLECALDPKSKRVALRLHTPNGPLGYSTPLADLALAVVSLAGGTKELADIIEAAMDPEPCPEEWPAVEAEDADDGSEPPLTEDDAEAAG